MVTSLPQIFRAKRAEKSTISVAISFVHHISSIEVITRKEPEESLNFGRTFVFPNPDAVSPIVGILVAVTVVKIGRKLSSPPTGGPKIAILLL